MQLSCIWLRKYLGEVRIFQVATEKYLIFLSRESEPIFQDKVSKLKKKITV